MKPAAFLDRDGVICEYVDNIHLVEDFKLRPFVGQAIRLLNEAGYWVFVITNQPMLGKGILTQEGLELIHSKMHAELALLGAKLDGVQYCPHFPGGPVSPWNTDCDCRKPKTGMIEAHCKHNSVDLENSFIAGDTWRDILCAQTLKLFSYGIRGGAGFPYPEGNQYSEIKADLFVDSLYEAVQHRLAKK